MTDIKYEPTRDHWTPYEPWMLNALAPDARVSWIDTDTGSDPTECRAPWNALDPVELARLNTLTPVGFMRWLGSLRVHPDDVPERPAEPDEALWEEWERLCRKAEAERDEWRARHAALRADVDEFQYKHREYPGTWELVDALARDHKRGEQA